MESIIDFLELNIWSILVFITLFEVGYTYALLNRSKCATDDDIHHASTHALILISYLVISSVGKVWESDIPMSIWFLYMLYHLRSETRNITKCYKNIGEKCV